MRRDMKKMVRMDKGCVNRGNLILVNGTHSLKTSPQEEELRCFQEAQYQVPLNSRAAVMLTHLIAAVNGSGTIVPVSGYRPRREQEQIYQESLREHGESFTKKFVALPGCSEHETGLAIDLGQSSKEIDFICPSFPYEGVCQRFREKAGKFGFIQRYQKGKEHVTGIGAEPWHFRYVGYPHSEIMESEGMALEEYVDFLKGYPQDQKSYIFQAPGREIEIYYKDFEGEESAEVDLPKQAPYMISGNNVDGLIVTVWR